MGIEDHRKPNGKYDGLGVMGELTGLGRSTMTDLWAQVKANQSLLNSCRRHDFAPAIDPGQRKRRCNNCRGEADVVNAKWYEDGLKHAAGRNG